MVAATKDTAPLVPRNVILQGDALQVMRSFSDTCIDTVLTDPPYSSGTRKEGQKSVRKSMNRGSDGDDWFDTDCLTTNGFLWLMRSCALEWRRLLRPGGHLLVFIDWRMASHLAATIESADLRQNSMLVWDKTQFGMGNYFRNQHECILHFSRGRGRPAFRHDVANVLSCPPVRQGEHPTEKPVELLQTLLTVIGTAGDIVLDSFAGVGSTCLAAMALGMEYIAIEKDATYVAMAERRLSLAQGIWRPPVKKPRKTKGTNIVLLHSLFEEDA